MKTSLRRSLVALTAACALLAVAATPASASTHNATVTAGTLILTKSGQATLNFNMAPANSCPADTVVADVNNTTSGPPATGTFDLTTFTVQRRVTFFTGLDSVMVITRTSSTAGAYSAPNATTATIGTTTITLQLRIYTVGATGCTPVTQVCGWRITLALTGTYAGDIVNPATGDVATLSGAGTTLLQLTGACAAPITGYTGAAMAVTGLDVTLT